MKIDLPIKIHNKFEIEVKDVVTGEIVQKGYAENIVLDTYFSSIYTFNTGKSANVYMVGGTIVFGDGQGALDPTREFLFNYLGNLKGQLVEVITNQVPLPSYGTTKGVIPPEAHIGDQITEVGIGYYYSTSSSGTSQKEIFTHALIKDSAGNPLTLGPKTATQEITIYSTIYFIPNFDEGITLRIGNSANSIVNGIVGGGECGIKLTGEYGQGPRLYIDDVMYPSLYIGFAYEAPGILRYHKRIPTDLFNRKIKKIEPWWGGDAITRSNCFIVDIPTLAENESSLWSGWEFDKTPIGAGDGSTTEFPLPWDEVWLDKPKTIYVDGVATAVTWTEDTITFAAAPADQAPITGSYWVKYVPKDENHVLDITFDINYAEGVTT